MNLLNNMVVSGIAGYVVSDNKRVKTHYDPLKKFSVSELRNMVCNYTVSIAQVEFNTFYDIILCYVQKFSSYECIALCRLQLVKKTQMLLKYQARSFPWKRTRPGTTIINMLLFT